MADKKTDKVTTLESGSLGVVNISERVVENIAGMAAREVSGVYELGKGGLGRVAKAFGSDRPARGVDVEVGTKEVAIDLDLIVLFGNNIQEVCGQVRQRVADRVKQMTGLVVKELNIDVVDIYFPEETKDVPEPRVQ